ncbi:ATP-binding protein [Actinomadura macrotermitis]|uniref:HTH luxR-type domain-containing protein n=1 Tax=Actinomadura macrotermitis TaxID=2585200 RepID=A0A7K0C7C7_9ACTN|nr:hypothetical protein [Actinomadura macrotermitis]
MSLQSLERRSGRLPAQLTSFVGRDEELEQIGRLFDRCRLVTLTGPGGVGKTRLAVRAADGLADRFPAGVCFVDLAALRDPLLLPQAVGEALGLPDTDHVAALDDLVGRLAELSLLLVLDTCEHLVDACALLAEVLLRNAPDLRVLVTSRQPLDVAGEHTLVVAPLASPIPDRYDGAEPCESVTLFAERAAAVVPGWTVTPANHGAVALLCHRLDGIPLALELAAVQLRALSVEQIVDRLDRRVLHVRAMRTTMPRHQTLQAAIDWSHELCSRGERTLWARLSVFAGDFDLEGAEHVCADADLPAARVYELLAGLVAKSIVLRADHDGTARYRMLDTIREYGAELLERAGAAETIRDRAFGYYAGRIEQARAELGTGAQPRWLRWFRYEQPNIRALMEHALTAGSDDALMTISLGVGRLLALQGMIGEIRHWYRRILQTRELPGPRGTELLALAGLAASMQGDLDGAAAMTGRAEERAVAAGDTAGLGYIREAQGVAALFAGDLDGAGGLLAEAAGLHGRAGTADVLVPVTEVFLAVACMLAGRTEGALEHAARAVKATEADGELWCRSYALCVRGLTRVLGDQAEQARPDLHEGLRVKRELGDRLGIALALDMSAACLATLGDAPAAIRMFAVADRLRNFTGTTLFGPQHGVLREVYEQQTREAVGEQAYRETYEAGLRLDMDLAVAEALGELPDPGPAEEGAEGDGNPLTPRELEIAGLVAQGLTNREIAARLVIAKRTADSHVEHILAKLGFTSRAQIAAWSARRSEP